MPDYKKMYHLLFNKITNIISDLQEVRKEAEEMYLSHEEKVAELYVLEGSDAKCQSQ